MVLQNLHRVLLLVCISSGSVYAGEKEEEIQRYTATLFAIHDRLETEQEQYRKNLQSAEQDIVRCSREHGATLSGCTEVQHTRVYTDKDKEDLGRVIPYAVAVYFLDSRKAMQQMYVHRFDDKGNVADVARYTTRNWRKSPINILNLFYTSNYPLDDLLKDDRGRYLSSKKINAYGAFIPIDETETSVFSFFE